MNQLKVTWDEDKRIEELYAYDILDTKPELDYDDLTYLAGWICKTPIALITFVDNNRQWFKSARGIDVHETPREYAFCAHALASELPLIVEDATQDKRFANNPLVTNDPHIRFYVGQPIVTPRGHVLGTLCVIDKEPKKLTKYQIKALRILAKKVMTLLELKKNRKKELHGSEGQVQNQIKVNQNSPSQNMNNQVNSLVSVGQMAHFFLREMGTPVSLIYAKASLLKNRIDNNSSAIVDFNNDIETIIKSIEKIDRAIKSLESFSLRSSNEEFRFVNIKSIIDMVVDICSERCRTAEVDIRIQPYVDRIVYCKPSQIAHMLMNLLMNSFEAVYHLNDKWIEISIELDAQDLMLQVTDSGAGLSEAEQNKLFISGYTTKGRQHFGMGLVQAKNIIELHKGQIFYDPSSKRTKFVVKIPLNNK